MRNKMRFQIALSGFDKPVAFSPKCLALRPN